MHTEIDVEKLIPNYDRHNFKLKWEVIVQVLTSNEKHLEHIQNYLKNDFRRRQI